MFYFDTCVHDFFQGIICIYCVLTVELSRLYKYSYLYDVIKQVTKACFFLFNYYI